MKAGRIATSLLLLAVGASAIWWLLRENEPPLQVEQPRPKPTPPVPAQVHPSPGESDRRSLREILAGKDPLEAMAAATRRIGHLEAGEFAAEWGALRSMPPNGWNSAMVLPHLLRRWGQVDPKLAMKMVNDSPDLLAADRTRYLDLVLWGWATREPHAAWDWALSSTTQVTGTPGRGGSMAASQQSRLRLVIEALVESGRFETGAELISGTAGDRFPAGNAAGTVAARLVQYWVTIDGGAALNWARRVTPSLGSAVLGGVAYPLAQQDPEAAKALIRSLEVEPEPVFASVRSLAISNAILGMSERRDIVAALAWLDDLAGNNPAGAYDSALANYFGSGGFQDVDPRDPARERGLIERIRDPIRRERTAQSYVVRMRDRFPEHALAAIIGYYPAAQQEAALKSVIEEWSRRDSDAALNHVRTIPGLRDELRQRLMNSGGN